MPDTIAVLIGTESALPKIAGLTRYSAQPHQNSHGEDIAIVDPQRGGIVLAIVPHDPSLQLKEGDGSDEYADGFGYDTVRWSQADRDSVARLAASYDAVELLREIMKLPDAAVSMQRAGIRDRALEILSTIPA